MDKPDLLLIIPSFLHHEYATQAVRTALASDPRIQVAVVDDGSPDWPGEHHYLHLGLGRVVTNRFKTNDRNVTRSWEWGARYALEAGIPHVAFGNSDLKFPAGWWEPLRHWLQDDRGQPRLDLAGPLTNAPGHRRDQAVRPYLKRAGLLVKDEPMGDRQEHIDAVQRKLDDHYREYPPEPGLLNGFLFAGRTDVLWRNAHNALFLFHPGPRYKMVRSEDELGQRFRTRGLRVGIVPSSFVFHYRGVTRPEGRKGRQAEGLYRPTGGLE